MNQKFYVLSFAFLLFLCFQSSTTSAEILSAKINLTIEGNLEKNLDYVNVETEVPIEDEYQKILSIESSSEYKIVGGKLFMNLTENNYRISFIIDKKFPEIKFKDKDQTLKEFLKNEGKCEWNEEIKNKAIEITKEISHNNKTIEKSLKVFKILQFINENIKYDLNYENIENAIDVYNNKKTTCTGFTNLFISMCRAIGIPARSVGGIAYSEGNFEPHSYAEIYINQWIPVDPTFFQFPADALHIAFYKDKEAREIKTSIKFKSKSENIYKKHKFKISANFIEKNEDKIIELNLYNENITGQKSIVEVKSEIKNLRNFYVFGLCEIFSNLSKDSKIFYLTPKETKNLSYFIYVPELEKNKIYNFPFKVKCLNVNKNSNFYADGDIFGTYIGKIEGIDITNRKIYLYLVDKIYAEIDICIAKECEKYKKVMEKGENEINYSLKYLEKDFLLTVDLKTENSSLHKEIFVSLKEKNKDEVRKDEIEKISEILEKNLQIIAFVAIIIIAIIFVKFLKK